MMDIQKLAHKLTQCRLHVIRSKNIDGVQVTEKHYIDRDGSTLAVDVTMRSN